MLKTNTEKNIITLQLDLRVVEDKGVLITETLTSNGVKKDKEYPMITDESRYLEIFKILLDIVKGLVIETCKLIKKD